MGGSSGSGRAGAQTLSQLESRAKSLLREGDRPRKNVFISFAHEDLDQVNLLRGQAQNLSSELEFNDWSLQEPFDSDRADYIRNGIRERIRQSSVTLVFVSDRTHESAWVNWEIRESLKLGKGVVAMHGGNAAPVMLPAALVENNIQPVRWNHDELMNAIDKRR